MPFGSKGTRLQNKDLRSKFKDVMASEYIRGGNTRCPSLIVGGLMLVLLFLACSWWSLTSQNFELMDQIENLQSKLKHTSNRLDQCSQQEFTLEGNYKTLQSDSSQQRVKYEQLKVVEETLRENFKKTQDELETANKKITSLESSVKFKTAELESLKKLSEAKNKSLEALRLDKKTLTTKLEEESAKVEELRNELSNLRKAKNVEPQNSVVSILRGSIDNNDDGIHNHAEAQQQDEANVKKDKSEPHVEPDKEENPIDNRELQMRG